MPQITTNLEVDGNALRAAECDVSVFLHSRITTTMAADDAMPGAGDPGVPVSADFELGGRPTDLAAIEAAVEQP
jgi:hypothetical protein